MYSSTYLEMLSSYTVAERLATAERQRMTCACVRWRHFVPTGWSSRLNQSPARMRILQLVSQWRAAALVVCRVHQKVTLR